MKQIKGGQFVVRPFGTDNIEQSNEDVYVEDDNDGLAEFISDGYEWSTLLVIGTLERFDYSVAVANTCISDSGASSCYDTSLIDNVSVDFAMADGFVLRKTGWGDFDIWRKASDYSDYLIDDSRDEYTASFTTKSGLLDFSRRAVKTTGGLYYFVRYTDSWYINDFVYGLTGEEDHVTAGQTATTNYLNTIGTSNTCSDYVTGGRLPLLSETSYDGTLDGSRIESAVNYIWTATPQTTPTYNDGYVQVMDSAQREVAANGGSFGADVVCVLDALPAEGDFQW